MPLSIDELRRTVEEYHNKGLNSQQIADELSLSQTTIQWLSSSNVPMDEDTPHDIMVGWRSVAVKAARVEAVSYVFCDIIEEEIGEGHREIERYDAARPFFVIFPFFKKHRKKIEIRLKVT